MLVDLHLHTTASDGIYTPEQIVDRAVAAKLGVLAITDHDTMVGSTIAARYIREQQLPLRLITGVEIDTLTEDGYTVHVLGYHFDVQNAALNKSLEWTRQGRVRRVEKIVSLLQGFGYELTLEEVLSLAGDGSVGRPHIARALIAKGYFGTTQEVFDQLLAKGRKAYWQQEKLLPKEAVKLLHEAGGIASLAHPEEVRNEQVTLRELEQAGFDALEVWHPTARENMLWEKWLKVARDRQLMMSGGSDFHGFPQRYPADLGIFPVQYKDVAAVIER